MNVNKYIECCLINEYAYKFVDGYELDVETLPDYEINNFLDVLMKKDNSVRDFVFARMQELVDARIPAVELRDKQEMGFISLVDSNNGDVIWIKGVL